MDPITAQTTVAGAIQLASQFRNTLSNTRDNINEISKYTHTGSLIDIGKIARVEPICVIDADVVNLDYTTEVLQSMQSLFAGYYLQAIALTGNVGSVSIASRLAPLNPNRDTIFESRAPDIRLSQEAYKYRLPTTKNTLAVSMEAEKVERINAEDATKSITEMSNLCVGKLYDVEIGGDSADKNKATIKIAIRLMVNSLPTSTMLNLLSFKDQFDMDMKERYHAWRAGRLSFIKDLVLCRDLVDKHRTALMKDKSDVYSQILNRENNNFKAGLFNKNPSLATASNLVVTSTDTIAMVEQKIGGKFSNFKTRQQIFDNTNLMIMAVVDKSWERVTFYHRGIHETTQVSIKDIKVSNKGNGPNIEDILKAYSAGAGPAM